MRPHAAVESKDGQTRGSVDVWRCASHTGRPSARTRRARASIHKVLGEGDFVLVVSEGQWNGTTNAFYDLLRFENGKAVEHWDVIQPVPTEGLANTNGMFGF